MQIAHTLYYAPHQNGMYETTREIVAAERKVGIDARMVDPLSDLFVEDRGAPYAPRAWMLGADIIVDHGGFGDMPETHPPMISMLHGTPEYVFRTCSDPRIDLWASSVFMATTPHVREVVTLSERYVPAWSLFTSRERISTIPPPVDLEYWSPNGEGFDFDSATTNIVITDRWKPSKDAFELLIGFGLYAHDHPHARLHLYAAPDPVPDRLQSLLDALDARKALGMVRGDVDATTLRGVYQSADLVLTSDCGTARTIREAMACGCPVLADTNDKVPSCNMHDPTAIAAGIEAVLGHAGPAERRRTARLAAERLFDPTKTVEGLQRLYRRILRG